MAEVVLDPDPQSFPIGTTVKVRKRAEPHAPYSAEPPGSILSEPVVASAGTLTVTGLTAGETYVGYASVGGKDRYLYFAAAPVEGGGGGGEVTKAELEAEATAREAADAARLAKAGNLAELASAASARTSLGLGTAATSASTAFDASGTAATAQSAAEAASTPRVRDHAALTAEATLVVNQLTPCNAEAGAFKVLLPEGAAQGTLIAVEKTDSSANQVTVEGQVRTTTKTSTLTLKLEREVKLLRADASGFWWPVGTYLGVATLDTRYTKKTRQGRTFALKGAVAVETIPGFFVDVAAGETKKLVGVRYKITGGTEAVIKIQRNGVDVEGLTALKAKEAAAEKAATAEVTLSAGDVITLVIESVSGSPVNLTATVILESTV